MLLFNREFFSLNPRMMSEISPMLCIKMFGDMGCGIRCVCSITCLLLHVCKRLNKRLSRTEQTAEKSSVYVHSAQTQISL